MICYRQVTELVKLLYAALLHQEMTWAWLDNIHTVSLLVSAEGPDVVVRYVGWVGRNTCLALSIQGRLHAWYAS